MICCIKNEDKRNQYIYEKLKEKYTVLYTNNLDEIINCKDLILPITGCDISGNIKNTSLNVLDIIGKNSNLNKIFTGMGNDFLKKICYEKNITLICLLEDEFIVTKNAMYTAEGLMAIMRFKLEKSFDGLKCLVLGYGRCGQYLCHYLKKWNAEVSIYLRHPKDELSARLLGYNVLKSLDELNYDVIINTIPSHMITKESIDKLSPDIVIFDIASAPGGTDFDYAKQKGINAYLELAIPAKFMARSAASLLVSKIEELL